MSSIKEALGELFSSPANRMFLDSDQVGQAFSDLASLNDDVLRELLPSHGFPAESVHLLRNGDHRSLIQARLNILINGEREFLETRAVRIPTERTAVTVADSDASDDE